MKLFYKFNFIVIFIPESNFIQAYGMFNVLIPENFSSKEMSLYWLTTPNKHDVLELILL